MAKILELATVTIYVDDFEKSLEFYQKHLSFEKKSDMGPNACWGKSGSVGIYLQGGNLSKKLNESDCRVGVVLYTDSVEKAFAELKEAKVELLHSEIQSLFEDEYWFQFRDPAGNILEMAGKK